MNGGYELDIELESEILTPSDANTVLITVETLTTGHQTLTDRSVRVSPSVRIGFNLLRFNPHYIQSRLRTELVNYPNSLSDRLASMVFTEARDLGFGYNGFKLTMTVKVTYRTLVLPGPSSTNDGRLLIAKMLRMVQHGMMEEKEFKSLKMETESCSICLEDFSGSNSKPTRMTCSHVFHAPCLVKWLYRTNSCPLFRTELYNR